MSSDSIAPKIDSNDLLMLEAIRRRAGELRRRDKYRDPDCYSRNELQYAVEEIIALHFEAYLETEAKRGNQTAMEVLMREPPAFSFTFPGAPERPKLGDFSPEKLSEQASYSMYHNHVFKRYVDSATHSVVEEVMAFLDAREERL